MIKPAGTTQKVKVGSLLSASASKRFGQIFLHVILIATLILMLMPFFWMVATSLKPATDATPQSLNGEDKSISRFLGFFLPNGLHFENYGDAWNGNYGSSAKVPKDFFDAPFTRYFTNSIIVGVAQTIGVLITCTMAAYAFARMKFWGSGILFGFILATMAIPHEASYIPNLVIVTQLGNVASGLGTNTYTALFLPWISSAFYIFLLRQFFMSLPQELYEAGQLDGLTDVGYLWRIAVPLSMPAILTVALFAFQGSWNAFLWPLIAAPTIPVIQTGLRTFLGNSEVGTEWDLLMAAATIGIIPMVFLYFLVQRRFIEGVSRTGIK
jgi:multiple sugar transport system permease protein